MEILLLVALFGAADSFAPVSTRRASASAAFSRHMSAVAEAPVRKPESVDRVKEVRERFRKASEDAAQAKGCAIQDAGDEWWRQPEEEPYRQVTKERPLRVIVAGGGVAGLVAAAACHSRGMKVAIFEQASQYAPYVQTGFPLLLTFLSLSHFSILCRQVRRTYTNSIECTPGIGENQ